MEIVKLANRTNIHGNCNSFPRDEYEVELKRDVVYMRIDDNDIDVSTSVNLEPKDAIKLAETILEYYKSRGL